MRFMHIADIHLGAVPDEGKVWAAKRKQQLWDAFAEVIEIAGKEEVDFLFIAGDLFHRQPLMRELNEVNYLFGRIPKTKVILMAGNHDYISKNSYYHTFEWNQNVTFFRSLDISKVVFEKEKVCVYGHSYYQRERRERIYDGITTDSDYLNILLAHGGDETHIPFSANEWEQSGFDYVACGHIHQPSLLAGNHIVMAGCLQPVNQNDKGQHGYWMGEVTHLGCDVKFYPMRYCEYVHLPITLDGTMTDYALYHKIQEILSFAESFQIYKFILNGKKNPEVEFDIGRILKLPQVVDVVENWELDYDFDKLKETYENQVIGRYIRALEQNKDRKKEELIKKALYYGVDALCKSMR